MVIIYFPYFVFIKRWSILLQCKKRCIRYTQAHLEVVAKGGTRFDCTSINVNSIHAHNLFEKRRKIHKSIH